MYVYSHLGAMSLDFTGVYGIYEADREIKFCGSTR